jgi:hypothetical protein
MDAARALLGREVDARAVEALRFPTALRPGREFTLSVELLGDGAAETLRFELSDGAEVFSSGRCRVRSEGRRRDAPGALEARS